MKYWEMVIYQSIESQGGEACLLEIYNKLHDFINFTERHLRVTKWGERPAYNI